MELLDDIWFLIFEYVSKFFFFRKEINFFSLKLEPKDLCRLCKCNRKFAALTVLDKIWDPLYRNIFGGPKISSWMSWKKAFSIAYQGLHEKKTLTWVLSHGHKSLLKKVNNLFQMIFF